VQFGFVFSVFVKEIAVEVASFSEVERALSVDRDDPVGKHAEVVLREGIPVPVTQPAKIMGLNVGDAKRRALYDGMVSMLAGRGPGT
jgi:hypothetical protein